MEDLPISEKAKYLGQTITFEQQETTEILSRIRAAWASFSNGHHSQVDVRFWHMDTITRTRETDSFDRRNARCSVSSFKQKESTRRKTKKEKTTENQRATKNWQKMQEVDKIRQPTRTKETARVQDMIKTATYPSRVTQMKTCTRQKLKRKSGSKKSKETQETQDAGRQHSMLG